MASECGHNLPSSSPSASSADGSHVIIMDNASNYRTSLSSAAAATADDGHGCVRHHHHHQKAENACHCTACKVATCDCLLHGVCGGNAASDHEASVIMTTSPPPANPAPLGLAAFALTTFVLSAHSAGWAPGYGWIGLALFYGGAAQFAAGMWEFKNRNVFAATAFTTYAAFWMGLGFYIILSLIPDLLPASLDLEESLGWFLVGFFIFNFYMTAVALMLPKVTFATFFLLGVTFFLLFVGNFNHDATGKGWTKAGGYVGIFTAAFAFYGSAAQCFNDVARREVMWMGAPMLKIKPYQKKT